MRQTVLVYGTEHLARKHDRGKGSRTDTKNDIAVQEHTSNPKRPASAAPLRMRQRAAKLNLELTRPKTASTEKQTLHKSHLITTYPDLTRDHDVKKSEESEKLSRPASSKQRKKHNEISIYHKSHASTHTRPKSAKNVVQKTDGSVIELKSIVPQANKSTTVHTLGRDDPKLPSKFHHVVSNDAKTQSEEGCIKSMGVTNTIADVFDPTSTSYSDIVMQSAMNAQLPESSQQSAADFSISKGASESLILTSNSNIQLNGFAKTKSTEKSMMDVSVAKSNHVNEVAVQSALNAILPESAKHSLQDISQLNLISKSRIVESNSKMQLQLITASPESIKESMVNLFVPERASQSSLVMQSAMNARLPESAQQSAADFTLASAIAEALSSKIHLEPTAAKPKVIGQSISDVSLPVKTTSNGMKYMKKSDKSLSSSHSILITENLPLTISQTVEAKSDPHNCNLFLT